MAQDTTLHQRGIFRESEPVSWPVLGDKFSTELRCFTPRTGIGYKVVDAGGQGNAPRRGSTPGSVAGKRAPGPELGEAPSRELRDTTVGGLTLYF